MNYCLYKLKFTTPLHIGESDRADALGTSRMAFCADTLFSALCHTAVSTGGEAGAGRLCDTVRRGGLLFSDAMPYSGGGLFIPKPYIKAAGAASGAEISAEDRKAMKKLSYIPVSSLGEFFSSLRGAGHYDAKAHKAVFGQSYITTKNSISRKEPDGQEKEENNAVGPYSVGLFEFSEGCGLYFIAAFENEQDIDFISSLVERLGLGGVGGKTSSGYGKFAMADDPYTLINDQYTTGDEKILIQMLERGEAPLYISLTTSLPLDEELGLALDGAACGVCRRGGFVLSENFAETAVKKRTQYFLSAGSVFTHKYRGGLYDAAENGRHPVYRYGMPLFLGVDGL